MKRESNELILVVEDDKDLGESVASVLTSCGYHVVLARNGRRALDLIESGTKPVLILLDLMMPLMNGWEFKAALDASTSAGTPVVVWTAGGGAAENARVLNAAEFLEKPSSVARLLAVVGRYLEPRGPLR